MRRLPVFYQQILFLGTPKSGCDWYWFGFFIVLALHFHTRQNRLIEVPDLYQIPLAEAEDLLFDLGLNFECDSPI